MIAFQISPIKYMIKKYNSHRRNKDRNNLIRYIQSSNKTLDKAEINAKINRIEQIYSKKIGKDIVFISGNDKDAIYPDGYFDARAGFFYTIEFYYHWAALLVLDEYKDSKNNSLAEKAFCATLGHERSHIGPQMCPFRIPCKFYRWCNEVYSDYNGLLITGMNCKDGIEILQFKKQIRPDNKDSINHPSYARRALYLENHSAFDHGLLQEVARDTNLPEKEWDRKISEVIAKLGKFNLPVESTFQPILIHDNNEN